MTRWIFHIYEDDDGDDDNDDDNDDDDYSEKGNCK